MKARLHTPGSEVRRTRGVDVTAPASQTPEVKPTKREVEEAPLPSGADKKAPPLRNAAKKTVFDARIDEVKAQKLTPGEIALQDRLDQIEQMVKSGTKVRCVFDLDNTVFDTRYRTLFVLQEFDRLTGSHNFAKLTVDDVELDGAATARKLGLPDNVVDEVAKHWLLEFWNPANLVHDKVIEPVADIIRRCMKAGAEIVYLTGRAETFTDDIGREQAFRPHTEAQLLRAGFPTDVDHLKLKPGRDEPTAPYKDAELASFAKDGAIGFFITEGRRDVQHLLDNSPNVPCFLLGCSLEKDGPACAGVPLLPAVF